MKSYFQSQLRVYITQTFRSCWLDCWRPGWKNLLLAGNRRCQLVIKAVEIPLPKTANSLVGASIPESLSVLQHYAMWQDQILVPNLLENLQWPSSQWL